MLIVFVVLSNGTCNPNMDEESRSESEVRTMRKVLRWFGCRQGKGKVFCVGLGKTGTTSVEKAFKALGFKTGDQAVGEALIDAWIARDFEPIFEYCETADAFQDIPFCLPYTFQALHQRFPEASFILTKRGSAEEWWSSLTRFHSKLWTGGVRIPEREDLEKVAYRYPGFIWKVMRSVYPTDEDDIYNREKLIAFYEGYNRTVSDYFASSSARFLVVDVSKESDYVRFCEFLGCPLCGDAFPWENRT